MEATHIEKKTDCLGCALSAKRQPVHVVFENDYVCCFLDHDPFNEGHTLILPKRHCRFIDELDEQTASSVMHAAQLISKAIKKIYNPDGITICQNGGKVDDLTHFHMHVVPRSIHQPFAAFYMEEPSDNDFLREKLPATRAEMANAINVLVEQEV